MDPLLRAIVTGTALGVGSGCGGYREPPYIIPEHPSKVSCEVAEDLYRRGSRQMALAYKEAFDAIQERNSQVTGYPPFLIPNPYVIAHDLGLIDDLDEEAKVAMIRYDEISRLMIELESVLRACGTYEEVWRNTPQVPTDEYVR